MGSFFSRFRNVLVLVIVLLAQTIGLAIQVRRPGDQGAPDGPRVMLLRSWAVRFVTPFERLFHGIGHTLRYGWSDYIDLRNTRQQNRDLQVEMARLRMEQSEMAEDAMQGHRLQALLKFQQHYVTSTVAAQVIGTSGTDQSRVLNIDKGTEDGLKIDQAVITPDGIVGKIRAAQAHTAQVLAINDSSSGAGVLLASTRIRAIVHGTSSGQVVITNLTPDSRIKPGEQVLSSGGDQIYPRGLPVGVIESIAPDPEHQPYTIIHVKPAANLFQLEEVLIITGTQAELPPIAQKDLAQGVATAEQRAAAAKAAAEQAAAEAAAKTAAEMVADKLPSIHQGESGSDSNAPDGTTKPDAVNPAGVVPKPLPTVHSDRFTPGTTPPATQLRPGADHPEGAVPVTQPTGRAPRPKDSSIEPENSPNN